MRLFRRALAQTKKEIVQFRRDPLTVGLAYALPFAALLMYGFAIRLEAKDIHVAVFNYDSGKLSREFVDTIYASRQFKMIPTGNGSIFLPLDRSAAKASIVIPPEFSRRIKSGGTADIQILIDGTDINNARVIKNGFYALTQVFLRNQNLRHQNQYIRLATRLWFNPGRKESLYIVPGAIALMTWIFPALLSAFAFVREKEQGTVLQLYASSITAEELVLGKTIAYFLIGMVEALLVIAGGILIFHVPFVGDPFFYALSTMLYVSSGVLFGMWAGSRASNQMAAMQICSTVGFLSAMLLSGFIYPIRNITYPISLLSNIVPARYYIEAARDAFVRAGSWSAHWYVPVFLLFLNVVIFTGAVFGMRKMQLSK
ncbi:MAG: ABC transporter permease [Candidatus Obscuribacterales bacterium]|nr:ABC transporter permease [Candidatus Obscuribacterales bacterium]